MKKVIVYITIVIITGGLVYGGWQLERYINYSWFYQSSIQLEIQKELKPLNDKILKLEMEIKNLKEKK